jgi:lambda family phage portal protein
MKTNLLDRVLLEVAPRWGLGRIRSRAIATTLQRHFEAAQTGRRTQNWTKQHGDANAVNRAAIRDLRAHARDLVRNNAWARRGLRTIGNNTVGWGIQAKPVNAGPRALKNARDRYKDWSESTQCDVEGQQTMSGLQRLAMETAAEAGEALVRRYRRPATDRLAIPLQLQVLEPDHIDTMKDGMRTTNGGRVVQGVEFDTRGKRVAYWLFSEHPGASGIGSQGSQLFGQSKRVPAEDIRHVYRVDRPGQVRGISWFAPVILNLKDFDEYEDATLMRQKIAACFSVFVTDLLGDSAAIGTQDKTVSPVVETIEPGMINRMLPGQDIKFAQPPVTSDHESFSKTQLRRIASGLGVTYEDLTGDYSSATFSSSRMARLAHWANVHDWRWNMLIPQLCVGVWDWAMEAALIAGYVGERPGSQWTPPPMPMIEPDKEGLAYMRLVRSGAMTLDEMVRQLGFDPDTHWEEYAAALAKLDQLKIILDSDARNTTQSGLARQTAKADGGNSNSEGDSGKNSTGEEVLMRAIAALLLPKPPTA